MASPAILYSFTLDNSPAEIEILSSNTLYELVAIGFKVCDPRPGAGVNDHLWNISDAHTGKKLAHCGAVSPEDLYCSDSDEDEPSDAATTRLSQIGAALKPGRKLLLEYDYGNTTEHTFTVTSSTTINNPCTNDFPRRKKSEPPKITAGGSFTTDAIDLDKEFSALNRWMNGQRRPAEVNLFQAGRKQHYGFLEYNCRMIYLPDRPSSLNHYLRCLEVGAGIRHGGCCNWQSVVIVTSKSKKTNKYFQDLEKGFCDAKLVPHHWNGSENMPDLATVFPKVAALAGYRNDKKVKKGWIRYKDNTLIIARGDGGMSSAHNAPKGTAYDGQGFHIPGPSDILLKCSMQIHSLHELFCVVEGLLQSM